MLTERIPEKEIFLENFSKLRFVNGYTKDKKLIQYIFATLERHHLPTKEFEPSNITLEHIMSQSSRKYSYVGTFGNLLPLSTELNQKAGEKEFKEKQAVYSQSQYAITKNFSKEKHSRWGKKEIENRTKSMAEYCYDKVWSIQ